MSDAIYDAALKDLANLKARCREIEAFLDLYERYKDAAPVPVERAVPAVAVVGSIGSPTPERKPVTTRALLSAVHDILEARGAPMPLDEIFNALVARGIVIGGKRPKHNLGQKLSADDGYQSYGKRGWYFANEPLPERKTYSHQHEWDENEKDPDDEVAGPSLSNGSEAQISQSTSVPSGRDMNSQESVSSVPQPSNQERSKNGLAHHW